MTPSNLSVWRWLTPEPSCSRSRVLAALHSWAAVASRPRKRLSDPLPESWSVADFADVREWLQYGTSVHCTLEERRYPVLRIPNIEPGRVNPAEMKYADLLENSAARYLLKPGDLLFIRTNGVLERLGACAVYQEEPAGALFAVLPDPVSPEASCRPALRGLLLRLTWGNCAGCRAGPRLAADGKYNLNTGTIDSLPLPLPPSREEQAEIVSVFEDHRPEDQPASQAARST